MTRRGAWVIAVGCLVALACEGEAPSRERATDTVESALPVGGETLEWSVRRFPGAFDGVNLMTGGVGGGWPSTVTYDAARGRAVVLVRDTVWEYGPTGWTARVQDVYPETCRRAVYEGIGHTTTCFEATTTWRWNGEHWTSEPATNPVLDALAWDPARARVVGIGGGKTHEWDGATWTIMANTTPPATQLSTSPHGVSSIERSGANLVRYRWTGSAWTSKTFAPAGANADGYPYLVIGRDDAGFIGIPGFDFGVPGTIKMVTLNEAASTFSFDSPAFPRTGWLADAVDDTARGYTVYFGQATEPNRPDVVGAGRACSLRGSAWTCDDSTPLPRSCFGGTYAAAFDRVYCPDPNFTRRLYEWDGRLWRNDVALPPSSGRLAYDEAGGELLYIGLYTQNSTYRKDASGWTTYPGLLGSTTFLLYDPGLRRVLTADAYGTYAWIDHAWQRLSTSTPQASDCVYDTTISAIACYSDASREHWDGAQWRATALTGMGTSYLSSVAHDPFRRRTLGMGEGNTVWQLDGTVWSRVRSPVPWPGDFPGGTLVFDGGRGEFMLVGQRSGDYLGVQYFLSTRGGTCATNGDCPGRSCVDGVCCESPSCEGSCRSCGTALDRGRCAAVVNAQDSDSCAEANGKSCDEAARCKLGLGAPATSAEQCASGFVVDGVCCHVARCGPCQACAAAAKESRENGGQCGAALAGTDPNDACAADATGSCRRDGACDGRGECRLAVKGSACGAVACTNDLVTGEICDGLGKCELDVNATSCRGYACLPPTGCASACTTNADCAPLYRCDAPRCVPKEGASCTEDFSAVRSPDGTVASCVPFRCAGSQCRSACASVTDCATGFTCSFDGNCVTDTSAPSADDGCRLAASASASSLGGVATALVVVAAQRRRRRQRRSRIASA